MENEIESSDFIETEVEETQKETPMKSFDDYIDEVEEMEFDIDG